MESYFISFGSVFIGLLVYYFICRYFNFFDAPSEDRKIHSHAKPTSAGLIFLTPILLQMYLSQVDLLYVFAFILLLIISGIDDFINVSVKVRLALITLFSGLLVYTFFLDTPINYLVAAFYVFAIIWWINLFNFMDGADGMAVGHSLITLAFYFLVFPTSTESTIILFLCISLVAFIPFNFPVSRMFMGDSGSITLAAMIAWIAFSGITNEYFGELFVFSLHLVFIIDATLTFFFRLIHGHKLYTAHNLHCYQSLIRNGMSHSKVTIIYSIFTLISSTIGYLLLKNEYSSKIQISVIAIQSLILTVLWFKINDLARYKYDKIK